MTSQIVLMTGCSSGIGLATAKRLALDADQRFVVIATVIAMSEKSDLEAAVGDALNKTIFIKELDVTKDNDITTVVDETLKTYGRIDVLLNIAGFLITGIPELVSREQMEKIFGVNVFGPIRLTQAVLPQMKRRKAGKILTLTSVVGRTACPYVDMYNSTKYALEGFFEGLAVALRSFNIRVCLIEPGAISTALQEGFLKDIDVLSQDETIDGTDRRQLQVFSGVLSKGSNHAQKTADDVAKSIVTRCLDVDEPVLRHLLPEDLHDVVRASCADITGETAISMQQKVIIE